MFGYATDETEELMPLSLLLAHKLLARLHKLRRDGTLPWALPDSKSQVSLEYFKTYGDFSKIILQGIFESKQKMLK